MKSFLRGIFGGAHAPIDEEFESRLHDFHEHTDKLKRVRVAMQLYMDAAGAMSRAESILADAFDSYYKTSLSGGGDDSARPPCHAVAECFSKTMTDRFAVQRAAINNIMSNRCIKPVTAILSKVAPIQERIKLRKSLLSDRDTSLKSLQRERDGGKPHDDPLVQRHSVRLDEVSLNLGRVISAVDASLADFKQARPYMLAQEMAAVIGCLYYNSTSTIQAVGRLLPLLPQVSSTLCVLNAMGTQKKRPSSLTVENLRAVEVQIVRKSIFGGRYGGYGLIDSSSGLLVPAEPLKSREALNSNGGGGQLDNATVAAAAHLYVHSNLLSVDASSYGSTDTSAAPFSPTVASCSSEEGEQRAMVDDNSPRRVTHPTRALSVRVPGLPPGSLKCGMVPTIVPSFGAVFSEPDAGGEEDSEDESAGLVDELRLQGVLNVTPSPTLHAASDNAAVAADPGLNDGAGPGPVNEASPVEGSNSSKRSSLMALRDLGRVQQVKEQIAAASRLGQELPLPPAKPPKP